MKAITTDNQDKWTSCELRQLIKLMDLRHEQELQLNYFDDEIAEHLGEQLESSLPNNLQK